MSDWKELRDLELMEKRRIKPKTKNQEIYVKTMHEKIVTVCDGPVGSGKTLLAINHAITLLEEGKIEKVILTRPLVTCGRDIGIFPGNVDEKIMPYMRIFLDVLEEFFRIEQIERMVDKGTLEMWPIELSRGLTFKNAILVADECHNMTFAQIHMLLTRFGEGSRVVIIGDGSLSQSDFDQDINPVAELVSRFKDKCHRDVGLVKLTRKDILRHPLVAWIDERLSPSPKSAIYRCPNCHNPIGR
jgi:phosphate starvation-inducible PhoH-like protein